jgi:hypothetical protein
MGKKIIFSLLLIILIFTGCKKKQTVQNDESWKDEILWAQECGLEGMMCCGEEGKEPTCFYGLNCCINPQSSNIHYCAEDCTCGKEKNFCCADEPQCDEGMACLKGFCTPCGDNQQPCCSGEDECSNELVCFRNTCVQCGKPGNPCCTEGEACIGQEDKGDVRTECRNNLCNYCGFGDKIACLEEPKCNISHLLINDICYICGTYNQPCCNEESGVDYICDPQAGLVCELGFCSTKNN